MLNDEQPPEPKRKLHPLEEHPQPLQPIDEGQPARPSLIFRVPLIRPTVTYVLLAINIVVFVVGALSLNAQVALFEFGVSSPREVLLGGDYYRLVTAMFLHGSIMHIFFNAYALYIIGSYIERLFGHTRFAIIYLLGGLGGSVLSVIMGDLSANVGSVGASGAVFAIFGAEMIYLYRHRELLGQRGRDQLRNLLVLLGVNFFIGIASSTPGARVRIDNWAHLGGLLGGLVLTWFIGPRFVAAPHPAAENALIADDTNPLDTKYWAVSLYLIGLVLVLTVVTLAVRR
jgi:rhomboid protease GluP